MSRLTNAFSGSTRCSSTKTIALRMIATASACSAPKKNGNAEGEQHRRRQDQRAQRAGDPVPRQDVQLEQDQQHADQRERDDQAVREPGVDVRSEEQRQRRRRRSRRRRRAASAVRSANQKSDRRAGSR